MTATQTTILTCLEINVQRATTRGLREFAQTQLDEYRAHLARRRGFDNPMERFTRRMK